MNRRLRVALAGNPNSGKSTLFNVLTGLNQKIANYPGVTVDQKTGTCLLRDDPGKKISAEITDLPGCYSLFPKSPDEQIPFRVLADPRPDKRPDVAVVIADGTNLKRSLFLCTQIIDLGLPVVLAINMMDQVKERGIRIDTGQLSQRLGIPVMAISARNAEGISELKKAIAVAVNSPASSFMDLRTYAPETIDGISRKFNHPNSFWAFQVMSQPELLSFFNGNGGHKDEVIQLVKNAGLDTARLLAREALERYKKIGEVTGQSVKTPQEIKRTFTANVDRVLTHRIWGFVIFIAILFLVFQSIFYWAEWPMTMIEQGFQWTGSWLAGQLPDHLLTQLLVQGILPGLGGVVVFVPQIALLFAFIAVLEDTGYLARVSFIMDRLMRRFGLHGVSVIPLISGVACAVPAIMSTRIIHNWKERLITIMVTPLMSCSARIPVYTLIIALIIPPKQVLGIFNLQGLSLLLLYAFGFIAAVAVAWFIKKMVKNREQSTFIMEMPVYRAPRWKNVGLTMYEKVKTFVLEAGKVIVVISVVLWALSSFGPSGSMEKIENKYHTAEYASAPKEEVEKLKGAEKLSASYAGIVGRAMEPVIAPLGFDWKIGIALLTSFAAREVFVGTMATIYSAGDAGEEMISVREKMRREINPATGEPLYSFPVGISLMIFYALAMQCMSTFAVAYRETKSWKWPVIMTVYMTGLAYLFSFTAYQLLK